MEKIAKLILEKITQKDLSRECGVELLQALKENAAASGDSNDTDIAIVGMSVRLPGAVTLDQYWTNLQEGRESIGDFPARRKQDSRKFLKGTIWEKKEPVYSKGGYLPEIDEFDYDLFKISPAEAELMDPHQRIFLENAWEALEDAGYGGKKIKGSKTGVFVGFSKSMDSSYGQFLLNEDPLLVANALAGNLQPIIASRISYILDLKGPSVLVDTACSSSLVAAHLACRSIINNESEMAIIGGVNLSLIPIWQEIIKMGIESPDYRTKTFDNEANGTCWSEGSVAVIVKKLSGALRDKDRIYGVIKGSAVNQDGASIGITAPNSNAQKEVILEAWKNSALDPVTISYIEAHGTGTKLGDPIEIDGLTKAFAKHTKEKQFCAIGSVKPNIGHLNSVSGLAGLVKVVLSMQQKKLPASINFKTPNANIDFANSPVYVNDSFRDWVSKKGPRRAGISSFGFSGTNCHMILEEAPEPKNEAAEAAKETAQKQLFKLSASGKDAFKQVITDYLSYLETNKSYGINSVCYTANTGRADFEYRLCCLVESIDDLKDKLKKVQEQELEYHFSRDGIEFGYCKIVTSDKVNKASYELTEKEKSSYTKEARRIIGQLGIPGDDRENLMSISSLYCKGADFDWDTLYGEKYQKADLPYYPFDRKRCWFDFSLSDDKEGQDETIDISEMIEGEELDVFKLTFNSKKHWFLSDHKINGNCVVPGTTWVEIINKIGKGYVDCCNLQIVFVQPVVTPENQDYSIRIVIKKQEGNYDFRITSKNRDGEWITHAFGSFCENSLEKPEKADIEHILSKCKERRIISPEDFEDKPIEFGPRWNNLKEVRIGEGEYVGLLELPGSFAGDLDNFWVHPSLLDVAANYGNTDAFYLPISYQSIVFFAAMPRKFYSYITKKSSENNNETVTYDLMLLDEQGEVFALIRDYSVKKVNNDLTISLPQKSPGIFTLNWIEKNRTYSHDAGKDDKVLIFINKNPECREIAQKIAQKTGSAVFVQQGVIFTENSSSEYSIREEEDDYRELFSRLREDSINKIVHLYNYARPGDNPGLQDINSALEDTYFSLRNIVRGIKQNQLDQKIDIVLVSDAAYAVTDDEETLYPAAGMMYGLGKVVEKEFTSIKCRAIDVDGVTAADTLTAEILHDSSSYMQALRKDKRYIEQFDHLKIRKKEQEITLGKDGVYLITGGTGAIGLEIADYLASNKAVHIALVNRSAFCERARWDEILAENNNPALVRKINRIREIEQKGARLSFYAADVADFEVMSSLVNELESRFGKVKGIVHSAGVAGDGLILNRSREEIESVLTPKVQGTLILHALTKEKEPDFFYLFSSINTLMGAMGQGDYSGANTFLNTFCQYRNLTHKNTRAINWAAWGQVGMAVDFDVDFEGGLFQPLATADGIKIFDTLFKAEYDLAIAGELNKKNINETTIKMLPFALGQKLQNSLTGAAKAGGQKGHEQVYSFDPQKTEHELETEIEGIVSRLWRSVLKMDVIDIYDSFHGLGGDSVMATRLFSQLEKVFPGILDVTDIFTYETIDKMTKAVLKKYWDLHKPLENPGQTGDSVKVETLTDEGDDLDALLDKIESGEISVDKADEYLK